MKAIQKLAIDDPRWNELQTGFETPFQHCQLVGELETAPELHPVLGKLGPELNNQGQIGDAEYAVLPWIVSAIALHHRWDFFAMSIVVDLDHCRRNSAPPTAFLSEMYGNAR